MTTKLGHLPWKTSACGLTAGEKFHRSRGKWGMKIYCGIASSLSERECALQSQSWTEYFMSLANVVCMIWTINQMLTACLGKQAVRWRRACRAPSKQHLGGKKGEKNNARNVYGTRTILLAFALNVWKFILIWVEAGASGESKISIPRCPVKFDLF